MFLKEISCDEQYRSHIYTIQTNNVISVKETSRSPSSPSFLLGSDDKHFSCRLNHFWYIWWLISVILARRVVASDYTRKRQTVCYRHVVLSQVKHAKWHVVARSFVAMSHRLCQSFDKAKSSRLVEEDKAMTCCYN